MLMHAMGISIFTLALKGKNVIRFVADETRQMIKRIASVLRRRYEFPKGVQCGVLRKNRGLSPICAMEYCRRFFCLVRLT